MDNAIIRKSETTDVNYISKTIANCLSGGNYQYELVNKKKLHEHIFDYVTALLGDINCYVVCDKEDNGLIYSFMLWDNTVQGGESVDVIHFIYTKEQFRGRGLMKKLFCLAKSARVAVVCNTVKGFYPAKLKSDWERITFIPYYF